MTAKARRTIVVGDVHGCCDELRDLLRETKYSAGDRVIFVGDLINKGPNSAGVLQLVYDLKAEMVLGNHELGFLSWLEKGGSRHEGFSEVARQLGDRTQFWAEWLSKMPVFIEEDDLIVVHAGLIPDRALTLTPPRILANIRTWGGSPDQLDSPEDPAWYELYREPRLVVFGHWARRGLVLRPNAIGLDSGCVYGKQLSALILPERRIMGVPARRIYQIPSG